MEKYPIPTHLKSILKVNEDLSDVHYIEGKITCNCGCEKFQIINNENREHDWALPFHEQDGLKIKVICQDCRKELLLFDQATQGFEGFVNHNCITAKYETLTELHCKKCNSKIFIVTLGIDAEVREQFIEECVTEFPDRFCPEDYVDAFNWITVNVYCDYCGHRDEWINMELS